jgi:hypothetical protein
MTPRPPTPPSSSVSSFYSSPPWLGHEPELLFTHRLKLGFVHPPRLPIGFSDVVPDNTDVRLIVFSTILTRFVTVSTASTPFLPLRMSLPRRISRFEIHLDHLQKWDFWTHRRCSAKKVLTMGKATPHPADRQSCGYKSTHQ